MKLSNGTSTALWHFTVAAVILGEDLIFFPPGVGSGKFSSLPLLQLENLAVALGLGLVAGALWNLRWARVCALLLASGVTLLAVLDQISVKLFLDHTRIALAEGEGAAVDKLLLSAMREVDKPIAINLLLAAALGIVLQLPAIQSRLARLSAQSWQRLHDWKWALAVALAIALLIFSSLKFGPALDPFGLREHPLVSLVSSAVRQRSLAPPAECAEQESAPVVFEGAPPAPDFSLLRLRLAAPRADGKKPNLILIVIESVGSVQLLKDGLPRAEVAPNLRALAERGAAFANVYSNYPATTRTHVPLLLGGRTLTWGGVADDLSHRYTGPTLPGELKKAGYRTALVSAQGLKFGSLGEFYRQFNYDLLIDPDAPPDPSLGLQKDDAWGISEEKVLEPALRFVRESKGRPFFLELLTNSTHHPYVAPGIAEGTNSATRYLAALHVTDASLGKLFEQLKAAGLDQDTIVAVIGDHGEGFADLHPGNLVHKSFLYEENVRSFLLLWRGSQPTDGVTSAQLASVGDVAPTLLSLLGIPADLVGQDLLSPAYKTRSQFFYTFSDPPLWGVRDGRWKYLARQSGERPQLYDLQSDPTEQRNLAAAHPEKLADAECRCRRWYLHAEAEFRARLEGSPDDKKVTLADLARAPPGPRRISLRLQSNDREAERVNPWEAIEARVEWAPDSDDRSALLEVRSPSGQKISTDFSLDEGTSLTRTPLWASLPLESGTWKVDLLAEYLGPPLLSAEFEVDAQAIPSEPLALLAPQGFALDPGFENPPGSEPVKPVVKPSSASFSSSSASSTASDASDDDDDDDDDNEEHVSWTRTRSIPRGATLLVQATWARPQAALPVIFELRHGDEVRREEVLLEEPDKLYEPELIPPLAAGSWTLSAKMRDGKPLGETSFEQLR